jgi:hypothetical protein
VVEPVAFFAGVATAWVGLRAEVFVATFFAAIFLVAVLATAAGFLFAGFVVFFAALF